jgi:hypothetical protein
MYVEMYTMQRVGHPLHRCIGLSGRGSNGTDLFY